jgi:hypothetical protein
VYVDIGGALALTPNGDVIGYDFETGALSIPEENRQIFALTKAFRRFPELRGLAPSRPNNAVNCPSCGGRGVIPGSIDCEACWGRGWITPPESK